MNLNEQQKAAVYSEKNSVITAGAGSGKTTVLAGRFLHLVMEKNIPVEKILCLTFTKKAANEMYYRIYRELAACVHREEGLNKTRAERALLNFYGAHIQTLDSYCASLVRSASSRYGVSPDFTEDIERAGKLIDEAALSFVIGNRNHPALKAFYIDKKPDEIARNFFAEPVKKYGVIEDEADFTGDVKKQFEYILKPEILEHNVNLLNECIVELQSLDEKNNCNFINPVELTAQEVFNYFNALEKASETECIEISLNHPVRKKIIDYLLSLYQLCAMSLISFPKTMREPVKKIRRLFLTVSALFVFISQAAFILSISFLQARFQNAALEKKRRDGLLTFQDVAAIAGKILLEHKDIRQTEKQSFSAIIIDEFQDNNAKQKDLLFLLAEKYSRASDGVPPAEELEEGKLFFVGDQKQSIYKFRGADVSVFRSLQTAFKNANFPLSANYRSHPHLVDVFNCLFGGEAYRETTQIQNAAFPAIFIPVKNSAVPASSLSAENTGSFSGPPLYEAVYEPLSAGRKAEEKDGGAVTFCFLPWNSSEIPEGGEEEDSPGVEAEACFVAQKIKDLIDAGRAPEDFAILMRAHSKEYIFEKHLRKLNIPYINENRSGVISIDPINDLLNALRISVYPMDALCYASFLRSPFAGISLAGTMSIMDHFQMRGLKDAAKITEIRPVLFLPESAANLNADDLRRFKKAEALYREICAKTATMSIAQLLRFLWYDAGYCYEIEWNPETAGYRELFDLLFALAVKADSNGMSLASWTDMIRSMQRSGGFNRFAKNSGWLDGLDVPVEREGAVSILTIHKSKGLEFPVVFICGAGSAGRNALIEDVSRTEKRGLSINPPLPKELAGTEASKLRRNYFYEEGRLEEKAKDAAELRRLLYVAMTRAESSLYITGLLKCKKKQFETIRPDSPLSEIIDAVYEDKRCGQIEKIEKGELRLIDGDSVIHDDSFMGLLLPAVAVRKNENLFTLERITPAEPVPVSRKVLPAIRLSDFLADVSAIYKDAAVLETPRLPLLRQSVSALKKISPPSGLTFFEKPEYRGASCQDVFNELDGVFSKYRLLEQNGAEDGGEFNAADFGTVVHRCVESLFNNETPQLPPAVSMFLEEDEEALVLSCGTRIAASFLDSPLGHIAKEADWRVNEHPFCCKAPSFVCFEPDCGVSRPLVSGVIDTAFEKDGVVYVVDFKTDREESPEKHAVQMLIYGGAAGGLWNKKPMLFLYYMRTGRAVCVQEPQLK